LITSRLSSYLVLFIWILLFFVVMSGLYI
jgi:hypothetical protein